MISFEELNAESIEVLPMRSELTVLTNCNPMQHVVTANPCDNHVQPDSHTDMDHHNDGDHDDYHNDDHCKHDN